MATPGRGTRVSVSTEAALSSPGWLPTVQPTAAVLANPPAWGEIVAYLTPTRIGGRTSNIISLGRAVGLFRPDRWRKQREPALHDMELNLEYLTNKAKPFDLSQPFGLYRHEDQSRYIDVQPLSGIKLLLRNVKVTEDGRIGPEHRACLEAYFRDRPKVLPDTEALMGTRHKRPVDGDVVFPVPGKWVPLGTPLPASAPAPVAPAAAAAAPAFVAPDMEEDGEWEGPLAAVMDIMVEEEVRRTESRVSSSSLSRSVAMMAAATEAAAAEGTEEKEGYEAEAKVEPSSRSDAATNTTATVLPLPLLPLPTGSPSAATSVESAPSPIPQRTSGPSSPTAPTSPLPPMPEGPPPPSPRMSELGEDEKPEDERGEPAAKRLRPTGAEAAGAQQKPQQQEPQQPATAMGVAVTGASQGVGGGAAPAAVLPPPLVVNTSTTPAPSPPPLLMAVPPPQPPTPALSPAQLTQTAALAAAPLTSETAGVLRLTAVQLGLDRFRLEAERRRAECEAGMGEGEAKATAVWACEKLIEHADRYHPNLGSYLESAIATGHLPPMITSQVGDVRTLALWKMMIDCLAPISAARAKALEAAAARKLPPPPLTATAGSPVATTTAAVAVAAAATPTEAARQHFQQQAQQQAQQAQQQLQMQMQMQMQMQQQQHPHAVAAPPQPMYAPAVVAPGGYGWYGHYYQQQQQQQQQPPPPQFSFPPPQHYPPAPAAPALPQQPQQGQQQGQQPGGSGRQLAAL